MQTLLQKKEAAQKLGIKWRKLDYLREAGQIPWVRIGTKVLFLESDLDRFIEQQRISARFWEMKNRTAATGKEVASSQAKR
jgi:excisionase family DNA binding protein